jgi:hypothetical protein
MRRGDLQDLLPPSVVSNRTRSEVLQELTVTSVVGNGASAGSGSPGGSSSGVGSAIQGSIKDLTDQLTSLTTQMASLASAETEQVSAIQDNTTALGQNSSTKGSGSSIGGTVGGIASSILGSGLSPIISGLIDLFGGGGSTSGLVAPTPFTLPAPVNYQGGVTGIGQVGPVDTGQSGQPRSQPTSSAPQVTVQVNAMDSQSFLDHSDEIASAVKAAILNSHSLNDVISSL